MIEIITEKTYTVKTYTGTCPICGKEKASSWKSCVDAKCNDCKNKRLKAALKHLAEISGI